MIGKHTTIVCWRSHVAPYTLLLVDRHHAFRQIVQQLLVEQYADMVTVVGVAGDVTTALALVEELSPQVTLLGLGAEERADLQLIPHLHQVRPATVVIVMLLTVSEAHTTAAATAGAAAWFSKDRLRTDFLPALQQAMASAGRPPAAENPSASETG